MPEITGQVHHVNLSVTDLENSTNWYRDLFDLAELARLSDPGGGWSKVILRHSSGFLIGLTQHALNDSMPFAERLTGFDHIALCVGDTDELSAWGSRLKELGIESSEMKTTPLGSLITVRDPDNIQIELYAPKS